MKVQKRSGQVEKQGSITLALMAIVFAVAMGNGIAHFGTSTMPFQVGAVMDGRGVSASQAGIFGLCEVGALACVMIFLSPIIHRFRAVWIALTGSALSGCAHFAMYFLDPTFPVLCALAVVAGSGYGLLYAAVITGASASENPDRIYALGSSGTLLIIVLLMMILPFVATHFGPFGIFLGMSAIILVASPALTGFFLSKKAQHQPSGSVLGQRGAAALLILWSLFSFGTGAIWSFAERIGRHLDLAPETIGFILSASTFCGLAGTIGAAITSGRVPRLWAVAIGLVGAGVGCLLLGLAWDSISYACGVLTYWIFYMYLYAYLLGSSAALDPTGRIGTAGGGCERLAFAVGAPVGGLIVDHGSFGILGVMAAVLCFIAIPLCIPTLNRALKGTGGPRLAGIT